MTNRRGFKGEHIPAAAIAVMSILLPALVACGPAAPELSMHPLAAENRLRSQELFVARKPEHYVIFNLCDRLIQFKNRGELLREFRISQQRIHHAWKSPPVKVTLVRKGFVDEPARFVIKPVKKDENGEPADTETVIVESIDDSYEVTDMPAYYTLEFSDGSQILVLSRNKRSPLGFFQRVAAGGIRAAFFWRRIQSPGTAFATIVLEPEETRALYWILLSGQTVLLQSPSGAVPPS